MVKGQDINSALAGSNNSHTKIPFTMEAEIDHSLPFLDVKRIKKIGKVDFDYHRIITHNWRPISMTHNYS